MSKKLPSHHTPLPVATMTFIILGQAHGGFYSQLSAKCPRLAQLMVWRIGAIINEAATHHAIPHKAMCPNIVGTYPMVRPRSYKRGLHADYPQITDEVQNRLQSLALQGHVKAVMECAVGIQESVLMLGFDKVIGAATATVSSSSKYIKLAHTTYTWTNKSADYTEKYAKYYASLQEASNPVDAFLTIV